MEIFALDGALAQLEAELASVSGVLRLSPLLTLAWHLRQRDTRRALVLLDEADALLLTAAWPADQKAQTEARILLIRGEAQWLFAHLAEAELLVRRALERFSSLADHVGCADAHWLLAWIAVDHGKLDVSDSEFVEANASAVAAGDSIRAGIAEAAVARWAVLRNLRQAEERWLAFYEVDEPQLHPALAVWRNEVRGMFAHYSSDFGTAATCLMKTYDGALLTGQIRTAIIAATNVAEGFDRLNDHAMALEWTQKGLDLARPTGWPRSVGACLMHMAETLRYAGRYDAAQEMLTEALDTLAPLAGSRTYAIALQYMGDLQLDREDYRAALDTFRQLEQRAGALDQTDFQIDSRRGQAHALSYMNQPEDALVAARSALMLAEEQGDASRQIEALKVLAGILARYPQCASDNNTPLHYLQQALEVAQTIAGYTIPGKLYDALSREYASLGDHEHAYAMSLQAITAREKTHGQEATNRAVAMQVMHQTARAKAEGEYHRELAAAEARRAELLHQTSATLERLSVIGREITAHLDARAVFEVLNQQVHGLLDVDDFAIYLCTPDGLALDLAFGIEAGRPLPPHRVDVSDPDAASARCVRERNEILADWPELERAPNYMPDTLVTQSALFAPLAIGERVLGVMTVQSARRFAYAERDRLIFRTLCAYGAIALDNAEAYRQLQDTQAQLVSREKLAALGSLVAGVAHELNTPIGNSLMMASTMLTKTEELIKNLQQRSIRRTELDTYLAQAQEASTLIMRGLNSAADLVQSFKQVAVDQTTAQRRYFDLQQVCHEIVATVKNQVKRSGHVVEFDVPEGITMNSYPGPLGQVISNFINNALLHAFEDRRGGHILLSARAVAAGRVHIQFKDNGVGIKEENLKRIFDPFFTTKMGQGGSGLGLSISYNIVTSILDGHILVQSAVGIGSTFTLDLPLVAPLKQHDSEILGGN
ncbi:MAG TPA: tetratricopeptide repeat-containing sensor histidine kinase [Burkholderiaceae bacterium]